MGQASQNRRCLGGLIQIKAGHPGAAQPSVMAPAAPRSAVPYSPPVWPYACRLAAAVNPARSGYCRHGRCRPDCLGMTSVCRATPAIRQRRISRPRSIVKPTRVWLRALPADTALSLYLHVPFCDQLCLVLRLPHQRRCAGRTLSSPTHATPDRARSTCWPTRSDRRLPMCAHPLGWRHADRQCHPSGWRQSPRGLRDRFHLQPDTEIAVEIDPRTLNDALLARPRADGHHAGQPRRAGFRSAGPTCCRRDSVI